MPLITPILTSDTFRTWVTRTNTVIDLLNSNTVVVGGNAIGAFTIGNSSHTDTSLSLNGGKTLANLSGLFLSGNSTFGANVSVNSSSLVVSIASDTTLLQSPTATVVNASPLTVNAQATFNGAVTLSTTSPLTVSNSASFSSNVTVANNLVASNTAYLRSILFSEAGAVIAATLSAAQYDNYSPSGLNDAQVLHMNPDVQNIVLTGIAAPTNLSVGAKVFYIQNLSGSYKITIKSESPSSAAANRFKTVSNQDVEIPPGASLPLLYTTATSRWRLLAAPSGAASTLTVSGAASFGDIVNVAGVATFTSNVAVDTNVLFVDTVNNRVGVNISSPTSPLHVVGNSLFGNVTVGGTSNVTGVATFSSTMSVAGAVNALSTLGVTGAVSLSNTLAVTGAVNVASTLGVAGTSFLKDIIVSSGTVSVQDNIVSRPELKDYAETVSTPAGSTLDFELGNVQTITNVGARTITVSNPPSSGRSGAMTIIITAGAGAASSWTWPAAVKWAGGYAPVLTTTNGKIDVIYLLTTNGGTSYLGFIGGQNH